MEFKTNPPVAATDLYPRLKDKIDALSREKKKDFIAWLIGSEGIECSPSKAYLIINGRFTGPAAERRAIAQYLGYTDSWLFKQS